MATPTPVRLRRAAALTLPALLLCLAVGGCTGEPEPTFGESSSTPITLPSDPSSPTDTESSTDPTTAEDVIREWVQEYNQMQKDGDTKPYRGLTRGCRACAATADLVDRIYEDGGFIDTQGWELTELRRIQAAPRGGGVFSIDFHGNPTRYQESKGGAIQEIPGGPFVLQVTVRRIGRALLIVGYDQVAT